MPIHGTLEEASLPDVLQLVSLGKKTGCLMLVKEQLQGEIYLTEGRITYATVINRPDRLGDVLVKRGRITRDQLNQAIALQARDSKKQMAQVLVESGQIEQSELERFVQGQVEEAVYFLFTWRNGEFTFTSDVKPKSQDFLVSVDPEGLLLEGARRVDEWSVIQKRIPSFDLAFRLEKDPRTESDVTLSEAQQQILPLVDGKNDVATLINETGLAEFEVGKALYGLITAGFAKLCERRQRIRHLDFRQLLAYLVREAEYADPGRRKGAAQHIADCSTCAARLKTIHVRRTRESKAATAEITAATPMRKAPAADPDATVKTPAVAAPVPEADADADATIKTPAVAPPEPADVEQETDVERRVAQRRDQTERRVGERRRNRGTAWPPAIDRRKGRDRRAAAARRHGERRAVAAGGAAVGRRSGGRTTGPRRAHHGEQPARSPSTGSREGTRPTVLPAAEPSAAPEPVRPAAAAPPEKAAEPDVPTPPPTVEPEEIAPVAGLETTAIQPAAESAPSNGDTAGPPPAPPGAPAPRVADGDRAKSKEIQWVVSPDESIEMIRASRSQMPQPVIRSRPEAPAAKPATPAKPSEKAKPAAAAKKDVQPAKQKRKTRKTKKQKAAPKATVKEEVATVEVPRTPPPKPVVQQETVPRSAAITPEPIGDIAEPPPRPAPRPAPAHAPARPKRPPTPTAKPGPRGNRKWVAVAAALVGIAGAGWFAKPFLSGGSDGTAQQASVPSVPVQAPPVQTTPSPPAPADPAPVTAEPALVPASGAEPAVVTDPPATTRAEPVASPPPAPAPAPVPMVLTGTVYDASTNRPLPGVTLRIARTGFSAVTGNDGTYRFVNPPAGDLEIIATGAGYQERRATTRLAANGTAQLDLRMQVTPPPVAVAAPAPQPQPVQPTPPPPVRSDPPPQPEPTPPPEPRRDPTREITDPEILEGRWVVITRAEAQEILGRGIVAVPGVPVESVAKPGPGGRTGVRVAQVLESGERLELVITRPPFLNRGRGGGGTDNNISAIRVAEPTAGSTTGTARLGGYLITAKADLPANTLSGLLSRLAEPQ